MNLKTLKYLKEDPKRIFSLLGSKGLLNWMPDKLYIKIQFRMAMGYWPNLKNPQTFNEKLQWLKLHDRNPLYTTLVDKYAVRKYIAETIGEEYLIPLVGGPWKNADEIDFDTLPEQFVLKSNHDSGGVIVCKDKSKLDEEATTKTLNKRLRRNFYWLTREWPYKDVQPCIFAEKYMEEENGELRDYKFFSFNGRPKLCFIATERSSTKSETKFDFFDVEGNHLPFTNGHPQAVKTPKLSDRLEDMLRIVETLSQGIPQVRVDLYEVNGRLYFGEMTFFHWGGMVPFDPPEWDKKIGSWLELPER